MIYPIADSKWVSPTQVVPKKSGVTVVPNENNELIPTRVTSGWRVCIDYRKLNAGTRKDHFPLPFVDQMLERVAGHEFYCFLNGYSGYNQIEIALEDQEKTTFTCPFGTFAFRKMPFGLCNAPGTFQRCMMGIFSDMIEIILEIFMDDFSVFGDSFGNCLENLRKVLERCQEKNRVLNWENCHFMVTQGIVLGHIVSKDGIEVHKAKVELISNLPTVDFRPKHLYKFITLLPKDYCVIPGNGAIKLVVFRPKHLYKFITLLPKDYCVIPGNGAIKLVVFNCIYQKSPRVNHFQFRFWPDILQVHRSTSNKMDISPNIDPTKILRILDQLP